MMAGFIVHGQVVRLQPMTEWWARKEKRLERAAFDCLSNGSPPKAFNNAKRKCSEETGDDVPWLGFQLSDIAVEVRRLMHKQGAALAGRQKQAKLDIARVNLLKELEAEAPPRL